jgi:hypothetical protein
MVSETFLKVSRKIFTSITLSQTCLRNKRIASIICDTSVEVCVVAHYF